MAASTKDGSSSGRKKTSSAPHETSTPLKRLYRSETHRVIAGVCGGLADYFALDATLIRIIFVILSVFNGIGVVIYLVLWLIVPTESQVGIISEDTIKQNMHDMRDRARHFTQSFHSDTADSRTLGHRRFIGIIIVIIGILFLFNALGLGVDLTRYWPLWLIGIGLLLIIFH